MTNLSTQAQKILDAYYSVYPVSGWYAHEGERLGIAAVLRVVVQDNICVDDYGDEYINPNDILKIVEKLEQF